MTLTVRLAPELRRRLESHCRRRGMTAAEAIAERLETCLDSLSGPRKTAFELAQDFGLVGGFSSGRGDLSQRYKELLKASVREKHAR